VATDDPTNEEGLRRIAAFASLPVRAMIAASSDIRSAIRAYYGIGETPKVPSIRPETPAPKVAIAPPVDDSAPEVTELPSIEVARIPEIDSPTPDIVPTPPRQAPIIREIAQQDSVASVIQTKPSRLTTPIDEQAAIVTIRPTGNEPPAAKKKKRKAIALTFLDGTTITLPAPVRKGRRADADAEPADDAGQGQLTAHDLTSALRALSQGADAREVLGESPKWEPIVGALLSLLLRKRLIADWEFIEEYRRYLG
jgi:type IV pilus assembly protein PilB